MFVYVCCSLFYTVTPTHTKTLLQEVLLKEKHICISTGTVPMVHQHFPSSPLSISLYSGVQETLAHILPNITSLSLSCPIKYHSIAGPFPLYGPKYYSISMQWIRSKPRLALFFIVLCSCCPVFYPCLNTLSHYGNTAVRRKIFSQTKWRSAKV